MVGKFLTGNGVMTTGKSVVRARKIQDNIDHMVPIFSFVPSLNNIKITMYFNYEPRFNSIFFKT